MTKIIDEREKFLEKNLKTETESNQKAQDLILDRDRKIKSSRAEAGEIIKETSTKTKNDCEKLIKATKKEIQREIEENRIALTQSSIDSKKELKSEVRGFVKSIVSKILNEEVEVDIEESKIEEYLKI